ncbi:MbtH family NRPS accessory protein [Streptomyces sp. NPDC058955]|uniref:MbtH family NRPS accessory protein n=1 Tax=unclassified Streptomyces TaxID=2593676 RepID=UPI003663B6DB
MTHGERYVVMVNDELQYATVPASWPAARGWRAVGPAGTAEECAARVDALWTDMRPLSLRRAMTDDTDDTPAREGR